MSIENYNRALKLIERNESLSDFVGKREEELISLAQETLKLKFSHQYYNFLKIYGAGNFGSEEIYGIIDDDFENSSVPDAIWYTLTERIESNLPQNLIIIYDTGGDEVFCLDFNKLDELGEPSIVVYYLGLNPKQQTYEVIANDFGDFLLEKIQNELDS